ncbi:MAG TPA: hypothetical protein VGA27_07995 [Candidatus Binatia bacterium]
MKSKKTKNNFEPPVQKAPPIMTSFMEIIDGLTRLTKDDAVVLAAVKDIFSAYRVRLAKSAATVRLVYERNSPKESRRGNLGRRSSAWA